MAKKQSVNIPEGVAKDLSKDQYEKLYEATIIHEKPLINALGANFKDILTKEKVKEIFQKCNMGHYGIIRQEVIIKLTNR